MASRSQTLVLPAGWTQADINKAPLALGPWRSFTFGRELRLETAAKVWDPGPRVDTGGLREENVETLMLLNLDRLFGSYQPVLCGRSLRDWSGADVEFTDPSGCRHVVELKYGAPANHVIDQVLSYALDAVQQASDPTPHFHQQPEADQQRFLACRIAGFWTGTRADKWKRETALMPAERDWEALRAVLSRHPEQNLDESVCKALADRLRRDWPPPAPLQPVLSAVHFHLVVPQPSKIHKDQLYALARLRWRGHRASVWQVAVKLTGQAGRLSIRECWVPPSDTSRTSWSLIEGTGPRSVRVGELLATAAAQAPALFAALPTPTHLRGETMQIGHSWYGDFPGVTLRILETDDEAGGRRCIARLEAWVINPASLDTQHGEGAQAIRRLRFEAVAEWILAAAPPREDVVRTSVRALRRRVKRWTVEDKASGLSLDAWHSSGLKCAALEIPLDDCSLAAGVVVRALKLLIREANSRSVAFGPEVVSL